MATEWEMVAKGAFLTYCCILAVIFCEREGGNKVPEEIWKNHLHSVSLKMMDRILKEVSWWHIGRFYQREFTHRERNQTEKWSFVWESVRVKVDYESDVCQRSPGNGERSQAKISYWEEKRSDYDSRQTWINDSHILLYTLYCTVIQFCSVLFCSPVWRVREKCMARTWSSSRNVCRKEQQEN